MFNLTELKRSIKLVTIIKQIRIRRREKNQRRRRRFKAISLALKNDERRKKKKWVRAKIENLPQGATVTGCVVLGSPEGGRLIIIVSTDPTLVPIQRVGKFEGSKKKKKIKITDY